MENNSAPLSYFSQPDGLVDHAWRVGARRRDQVLRSLNFELEAYRERDNNLKFGGAVISLI